MKIWIKLLIGIALGIIIGLLIPKNIEWGTTIYISIFVQIPVFWIPGPLFFEALSQMSINIGRYCVFPLVFFSLVMGTYQLKAERRRFRIYGKMYLYLLASTFILVIIGVVSVLIFFPGRIRTVSDTMDFIHVPGFKELILSSFPKNLFTAFIDRGDFLLPIVVIALIFGMNLEFDKKAGDDKSVTRPILQLADGFSRFFYHINSFLCEIFAVGIIFIVANSVIMLKSVKDLSIYFNMVFLLSIDVAIVIFLVFPGILYYLGERKNPYKWLYAMTGPLLTALATGDEYVSIGMLVKHGKENTSVPRKIGSITYPIYALFGKAGTALVTSVCFIVISKSVNALDITFFDVIWVIFFSFLVSFAVSPVPGLSTFAAIFLLWRASGNPAQESYLIVEAVKPLLISFGVVLDVATSAFVTFLINHQEGAKLKIEANDFI